MGWQFSSWKITSISGIFSSPSSIINLITIFYVLFPDTWSFDTSSNNLFHIDCCWFLFLITFKYAVVSRLQVFYVTLLICTLRRFREISRSSLWISCKAGVTLDWYKPRTIWDFRFKLNCGFRSSDFMWYWGSFLTFRRCFLPPSSR
jgi:hypothetical protein